LVCGTRRRVSNKSIALTAAPANSGRTGCAVDLGVGDWKWLADDRHSVEQLVNLPGLKAGLAVFVAGFCLRFVRSRGRSSGLHPFGWWLLVTSRCP
jgi:hypothetical protein